MRRKSARQSLGYWAACIAAAVVVWLVWTWVYNPTTSAQTTRRANTTMLALEGELDDVRLPEGTPSQICEYPGFKLSFNRDMHVPNYVVWELTAEETSGAVKRESAFYADKNVKGCATPADYKKSGYTRGHMAPAADMKWSAEAMHASNSLANICPQAAAMNSGAWSTLEDNCRQWAQRDSAIVIVAGPVLTDRMPLHIGKSKVVVPERFFKVVLAPYANPPRGIGFIMPNGKVQGGVQACAMSIDEVEQITGLDFFSALPDEIETKVEKENSYPRWQTLK